MSAFNFLETPRFPTGISFNSEGGPNFSTIQIPQKSGRIAKLRNWDYPLQSYNVLFGIRKPAQLEEVRDFWYAVYGPDGLFRYKDFQDFKSCKLDGAISDLDQVLGTGDGVQDTFEIIKTYQAGTAKCQRVIQYPIPATLKVAVGGISSVSWSQLPWPNTNKIQFATGAVPATGQQVTAGFEHDVLCSFQSDSFNAVIRNCDPNTGQLMFNVNAILLGEELVV